MHLADNSCLEDSILPQVSLFTNAASLQLHINTRWSISLYRLFASELYLHKSEVLLENCWSGYILFPVAHVQSDYDGRREGGSEDVSENCFCKIISHFCSIAKYAVGISYVYATRTFMLHYCSNSQLVWKTFCFVKSLVNRLTIFWICQHWQVKKTNRRTNSNTVYMSFNHTCFHQFNDLDINWQQCMCLLSWICLWFFFLQLGLAYLVLIFAAIIFTEFVKDLDVIVW